MLIMATIILIETIIIKLLIDSNISPPTRLQNFLKTNVFFKYFVSSPFEEIDVKPIRSVQKKEESEDGPSEMPANPDKPKEDWTIFCRFIDRFMFAVCAVFYAAYRQIV
jgi:hypothetical protein